MTSSFDNRLANLLAVNFNVVQGCTMHFAVEGNAAASPRRIPATLTAAGEPSGDRGGIRRAGDMEIVAINRSRHELFHYKAACSGSNTAALDDVALCAWRRAYLYERIVPVAADRRRGGRD